MSEKSSRRFWIGMILAFFSIDIVIATAAIYMAVQDPSFRSIPGFSQRSVNWGERQEKQRALSALGWSIQVDSSRTNPNQLALKIVDSNGDNVKGAKLLTTVFHYTRVAEQQTAPMLENDGVYVANFDLSKPGYWNIDIEGISGKSQEHSAEDLASPAPSAKESSSDLATTASAQVDQPIDENGHDANGYRDDERGVEFWHQMRWENPRS